MLERCFAQLSDCAQFGASRSLASNHALGRFPFGGPLATGAVAACAGGRALLALSSLVLADPADPPGAAAGAGSGATSMPRRRMLWWASTFASIVLKISGWSDRNCLAFSRP